MDALRDVYPQIVRALDFNNAEHVGQWMLVNKAWYGLIRRAPQFAFKSALEDHHRHKTKEHVYLYICITQNYHAGGYNGGSYG